MDKIIGLLRHEGDGDDASPIGRLKSMATTIGHLSSLSAGSGELWAYSSVRIWTKS